MLLQVTIRCRFVEEEVKELHGTHGKPVMTPALCSLVTTPESVESFIKPLERFVILLYDRTSNLECVNNNNNNNNNNFIYPLFRLI